MIYLNGRFLTQPVTGVQRYCRQLTGTLDRLLASGALPRPSQPLVCLAPPDCAEEPGWSCIQLRRVGRLHGNLWEQIDLPYAARDGLLFSPANIGPYFHANQVISILDASVFAFPQAYSLAFRSKYRLIIRRMARIAQRVLTISEFSKRELVRFGHIPAGRIEVIPLAGEQLNDVSADEGTLSRYGLEGTTYFLGVGSQSPHKNFRGLVQAYAQLQRPGVALALVGGTFGRVFQSARADLPPGTHLLGYLQDAEIKALYQHAAGFVFPSFYEGFGLPVLEAMQAGCPVISSNAASLPEVGGDAVLYCDPADPSDIARQMAALLDQPGLGDRLRQKGFIQARRFSWDTVARRTWEILLDYGSKAE